MFLIFELRKACRQQKHVHMDAFLLSTGVGSLGWAACVVVACGRVGGG